MTIHQSPMILPKVWVKQEKKLRSKRLVFGVWFLFLASAPFPSLSPREFRRTPGGCQSPKKTDQITPAITPYRLSPQRKPRSRGWEPRRRKNIKTHPASTNNNINNNSRTDKKKRNGRNQFLFRTFKPRSAARALFFSLSDDRNLVWGGCLISARWRQSLRPLWNTRSAALDIRDYAQGQCQSGCLWLRQSDEGWIFLIN